MKIVALDAGGATLKASVVASGVKSTASILANHVASTPSNPSVIYMGQKLQELERHRAKLRYLRPVQRGYCVNWNVESELWSHLLSSDILNVQAPSEYSLIVTAPLLAPTVINEYMDQVIFEEQGFQSYARVSAAECCVLSYSEQCEQKGRYPTTSLDKDSLRFLTSTCHLVVDSGFSFTHVVPLIDGRVYAPGVRRLNVSGKLLTNYLKEIVSYRQWNVMDDTPVINELKEALCYCSLEFEKDLKRYHNDREARKHWILPDFVRTFKGRCREDDSENMDLLSDEERRDERPSMTAREEEQALEMGIEMVTVPEVLFNPSDIGINQAGIAETIVQSVEACPNELAGCFYANILLVGGNTKFKNFRQRLERELRSVVPIDFDIGLHEPADPILAAWEGCCSLARSNALSNRVVSKKEYDEHGSNICRKRFASE
ncbi:hypothetical protein PsorP6_010225 [Peronosclerospora sorghi]|uniref:Uncharacterized protein n=1 Tax=Peronosclerospora sorghi TaxID=230839 RepID=A0ACC0VVK0_9STRA|nr:hypothetical protein PsorP6_010225 [Peronosclerospora sorghi]